MSKLPLSRRVLLHGAGAGMLAGGMPGTPRAADRPFTVVLESEVTILDPHMTTAAITRTFGTHVFDTLFASTASGEIKPQMVDRHTVSDNQRLWRFTLRDGLRFHDGAPVTAADCVASLQRWAPRDALGRMMLNAGAIFATEGERTVTIQLKQPFPLMLDVLGKPNAPLPVIMPARIMAAVGDGRIKEIVGSGPFGFNANAWRPGDSMVLQRFPGYVARPEPPDFLAGGKMVNIDQVVLRAVGDDVTGANALIAGEVDYMQYLPFDLIPKLDRTPGIKLMTLKGLDMFQGNFRLNHASGPFADPAIRAVLWKLVDQRETLEAVGIPARFRLDDCPSYWMCGTPLTTSAGATIAHLDVAAAKADLARTAYRNEPVVMLQVAGSISQTAGSVLAQHMKEAGFTVEEQVMDWGTVLARRAKRDGWSLFPVYANGTDMASPLTHFYVSNNCGDYPGWSCSPAMTRLLEQYAQAPDQSARATLAAAIQEEAYRLVPSVMWGQFSRPAGYRTRLQNLAQSAYPIFWGMSLAGA